MENLPEEIITEEKLISIPQIHNAIEIPIIVINQDGRILYSNSAAARIYNLSSNNEAATDINKIFLEPPVMEFVHNHLDSLQPGGTIRYDFVFDKLHHGRVKSYLNISLIQVEDERYIGLVGESNDGSEALQLKTANEILTEVDTILGGEVDYDAMLKKVVEFVIPQLADICTIHLQREDGSIERMALAGNNLPDSQALHKWLDEDLPDDDVDGIPAVFQFKDPILVTEVNQFRRAAKAGIKSYMILPLITHRQVKGAVTFISVNESHKFDQDSLELAKNLAINISIYLEKNRLYNDSQILKAELEQRVNARTAELSEAIAQLKQSEQMIQTLFRISKKLNATMDVDLILDELALEAIQIVNGESGFAGLRTEGGMQVKKYFHNGEGIPFEHTWAIGEGIPGWVLKYKVPYGTSDPENDPLIRRELKINENLRSIICTPILDSVGEVIGYFDIRDKQGAEGFSISDQEMLLTLAPVASIAIQNAIAYQRRLENVGELKETSKQLEELAARLESTREEERMRISRELHDQLGQSLTALKFDLTTLSNQLSGTNEELAHKSKDILTQLNTMIKTVRRISTELRPGMLDDLGLVASLEWQASDFQKRTGIECKVTAPGSDVNLTREQSLTLFRIFQEALTNVVRYAGAKQVDIILTTNGEELNFEFHDDGRGIRKEEISGKNSLGLLGMQERVKHTGGTFSIKGEPDRGTTITVTIPLQKN